MWSSAFLTLDLIIINVLFTILNRLSQTFNFDSHKLKRKV